MFLVTYRNHRKIFAEPTKDIMSKEFNLVLNSGKYFLQYYNEDFKEFVDCDWEQFHNVRSRRLQICEECDSNFAMPNSSYYNYSPASVPNNFGNTSYNWTPPTSSSQTETSNHSDAFETESLHDLTEKEESDRKFTVEDIQLFVENLPTSKSKNCDDNSSIEDYSNNIVPIGDLENEEFSSGWPHMFPNETIQLPYINPESRLGQALNKNKVLTKQMKHEFLTKIYDSFSERGIYYLGHRYEELVSLVLNTYPSLTNGLPIKLAKRIWKKSFYAKFSNAKRREDAQDDRAIAAAAVRSLKLNRSLKTQTLYRFWSMNVTNFCLPSSDKECHSHDDFKSWMAKEIVKNNGINHQLLSIRMNSTFKHRRNLLFDVKDNGEKYSISEIIAQYPCLSSEYHATQEVERIFGEKDHSCIFMEKIEKAKDLLEKTVIQCKAKYRSSILDIEDFAENRSEECAYKVAGLMACLLQENPNEIIGREMNESGAPFLHVEDNKINLMVDRVPFIREVSSQRAVFLWLSSFLIFCLEPPQTVRRTVELLQYLVFNLPKKPEISPTAFRVYSLWYSATKDDSV